MDTPPSGYARSPRSRSLHVDPSLWRAGQADGARAVLPTGHATLDALLADGGWPRAALSELLLPTAGMGEMPLLLPVLRAQSAAGGRVVLVSPPFLPCLAAWQHAGIAAAHLLLLTPPDARSWLWCTEQAARTPGCAVLAWPLRQHPPGMRELRRLQLAAQHGNGLLVLLRDARLRTQSSPAALRLLLAAHTRGQLHVEVVKQRGGFGGGSITMNVHHRYAGPRLMPWQLPVHLPIQSPACSTVYAEAHSETHAGTHPDMCAKKPSTHFHETSRALAGHPFPRTADRSVDANPQPRQH